MQTIVVTDNPSAWSFLSDITSIIEASEYLANDLYLKERSLRVINLCQSYEYQTIGYYVSLLAQARDHKIIPSILNTQDTLNKSLLKHLSQDIEEKMQHDLEAVTENTFSLNVYFGQDPSKKHGALAKHLHSLFPFPLLRFTFENKKRWSINTLTQVSPADVPEQHRDFMQQAAKNYLSKKRFHLWQKKQRFHNMAILLDKDEANAPSNKEAINAFIEAGESLGLNIDLIDKNDAKFIPEYDALFIRATTCVNHYTYRFARRAFQENLVVMDDPQSIVKCTNKVYLAELLRSHQVLTPDTLFISKYDEALPPIEYPCVLKKPDSGFSKGVIKLNDEKSLEKSLKQFFKTSDLVLVQPFVPTEFDWRIGILDNKPLFASRYFMAKDHWQIYNWESTQEREGDFETVALEKVPDGVLKTALKAARLIGDGLYGVDMKSLGNRHYVIEVNDNPNIDYGVEDVVLGGSLYHNIMSVFLERIRRNHGYA